MKQSLKVARNIKSFLAEMETTSTLSSDERYALDKDKKYIDKSIAILSGNDSAAINDLWREVQYMSQFFGGDYAEGSNQLRLLDLMDQFETALLDDVVAMRSNS
jgi:hypothetical protein